MAQGDKSAYYQALKGAGFTFDKHYREYSTEDLQRAWELHAEANGLDPVVEVPVSRDAPPARDDELAELRETIASVVDVVKGLAELVTTQQRRDEHEADPLQGSRTTPATDPPVEKPAPEPKLDPNKHAGVTLNTHGEMEVIEVDQYGNEWYQKEVRKPASPRPRGRRVLRYNDPGVRTEQVKVGEYTETFEVAGDPANARPSEIKITLPSYQTGIYKPPNMPFRVHTYNGARGFDRQDVHRFYGGADLVPSTIKKAYVSTDLCYDITTTIRAIEDEYRERVLAVGKGLSR